ncbi:AAA family ATPase [Marinobacteraceae bacterium S3BR75-40.1]
MSGRSESALRLDDQEPAPVSERRPARPEPGPAAPDPQPTGRRRKRPAVPSTIAVTGGKGGVGKTSIALNLALVMARQGHRTLLLDGDVELANVNVMLGLYPGMTLEHVILGERSLREVLLPVRRNLDLLPGASGVPGCFDLAPDLRKVFLNQLATLEQQYDQVIIDTAAGLKATDLHMIASSHLACVVITPDPTSLTDAFSLLKVLYKRGYRRTPSIIVNMAKGSSQAQAVYRRFSAAVERYTGLKTHYLGAIWRDETISQSITSQRPVAMLPPSDPSCRQFWSLADMLSVRWSQGVPPSTGFSGYWKRLLDRREAKAKNKPENKTDKPAGPKPGAAGAPVSEQPQKPAEKQRWPEEFRAWLQSDTVSPLERYETIANWLEQLGEGMDEDLLEALQTGLSSMQWQKLPNAVRASAAAHFRQLAELVDPPLVPHKATEKEPQAPKTTETREKTPDKPGEGHHPVYDEAAFGSQDALLDRLRQQPQGQSINSLLEALRASEQRPAKDSGEE